ncbi:hypothetical protein JCM3766R1_005407 [Sporobolomyces carnicolor]
METVVDPITLRYLDRLPLAFSSIPRFSSSASHSLASRQAGLHSNDLTTKCLACRAEVIGGNDGSHSLGGVARCCTAPSLPRVRLLLPPTTASSSASARPSPTRSVASRSKSTPPPPSSQPRRCCSVVGSLPMFSLGCFPLGAAMQSASRITLPRTGRC